MERASAYRRFGACLVAVVVHCAAFAAEPTADDPFRYLEDGDDPRTQEFFRVQATAAEGQLAQVPGRAGMLARIRVLTEAATAVTEVRLAGPRVFYLRQGPGPGQAVLCARQGFQGAERVLLDPANFDEGPLKAAIDWYAPSQIGRAHV